MKSISIDYPNGYYSDINEIDFEFLTKNYKNLHFSDKRRPIIIRLYQNITFQDYITIKTFLLKKMEIKIYLQKN